MIVLNSSSAFLNVWWLYLLIGLIFTYILAQSFYFVIRAMKRARALKISGEAVRKTIISSMVFSIAPSIAILLGLVLLAPVFGSLVAGMRLATLGAYTYEIPAATNVIRNAFGQDFGDLLSQDVVVTAIWVMTLGCIPPLLIVPIFLKKMNLRMENVRKRDAAWNQIMMDALFIGMISAFVGLVLAPRVPEGMTEPSISLLAILTLISSALLIVLFGFIIQRLKWAWLKNYALPLSMILAMALAILYASWGVI